MAYIGKDWWWVKIKHLGDITKLNGHELPFVDVVTGGSPCQDLSVAGKRAGLAGERSGLFMEQIRIIKELRNECIRQLSVRGATYTWRDIKPRYMVWENVPGAFSSNKGEDFRAVLEETARVVDQDATIPGLEGGAKWTPSGCIMGDGWSIAWRVHDAQFWGVPQRRKRIALVADFGGATAPEILFERQSVPGDSKESGTPGKRAAGAAEGDTDKAIYDVRISSDGTKNWRAHAYETEISRNLDTGGGTQTVTTEDAQSSKEDDTVYCLQANGIDRAETAGCNGKGWRENESYTLNTIDRHAVCQTYQKTTGALCASGYEKNGTQEAANDMYVVQSMEVFHCTTENEKAQTLKARDYKDPQVVAYENGSSWDGSQVSPTLTANC